VYYTIMYKLYYLYYYRDVNVHNYYIL
jgi:hypothetical protein